jgi:6-pyruvoyltetrahydropterin/6-carboxytetrahydropterin synthase
MTDTALRPFIAQKVFSDFPCVHRVWNGSDRLRVLHGYCRSIVLVFGAADLDPLTGVVVDFSSFAEIKRVLTNQFDHTTIVAADDPELGLFQDMAARGIVDLRIMAQSGIEGAAAWILSTVGPMVSSESNGRVELVEVEVRENEKNSVVLLNTQQSPQRKS